MENNNECKAQIMDYLKGSPDLTVYYYKPWGDGQRTKLHTILQDLSGNPGSSYNNTSTPSTAKSDPTADKPKSAIQPNKDFDTPKTESKSESGNDEDMEKWLNGVS